MSTSCRKVDCCRPRISGSRLCAPHWEVSQRYKPLWARRLDERRRRKRIRAAQAKERAERRADARAKDGTAGRQLRRQRLGAVSRAEADAAKRAANVGSARQTQPWLALGISRATYYRRGLHLQVESVRPGSADTNRQTIRLHRPAACKGWAAVKSADNWAVELLQGSIPLVPIVPTERTLARYAITQRRAAS